MAKRVVLLDNVLPDLSAERAVAEKHGPELVVLESPEHDIAVKAATGADVILSQGASYPVTAPIMAAMKTGGAVLKYGAGYDKVDVIAAERHGIRVAHIPDGTTEEVAEHCAAMILNLLRRLPQFHASMVERNWNPTLGRAPIRLFSDVTIGLIGYGRIARALHEKLRSLGFEFATYDPFVDPATVPDDMARMELHELAEKAQVLSLHLGASEQTIGMIDGHVLRRLGPEGFLVNTSRGALINEGDLVSALSSGAIAGAALDAFTEEPLPKDSPLRTCPNLLLSPHAAFYSRGSDARVQRLLAEELDRALSGEPLRCPIPEQRPATN